jgi:hypothetical protein
MRIEQFMPTSTTGYEQFYVNCAFVNIIGPGGGTPTEFARFPGAYKQGDPGESILPNFCIPSKVESSANLFGSQGFRFPTTKKHWVVE